ncbi:hypothetical protein ACJJTC_009215 [Scirpophaga incertulas]
MDIGPQILVYRHTDGGIDQIPHIPLDAERSSKLRSAVSITLSSCGPSWLGVAARARSFWGGLGKRWVVAGCGTPSSVGGGHELAASSEQKDTRAKRRAEGRALLAAAALSIGARAAAALLMNGPRCGLTCSGAALTS